MRKKSQTTKIVLQSPIEKPGARFKFNYSKVIITLFALASIGWITADYVIAFTHGYPINQQTTLVIIPSLAATILGYCYKSLKEKESRNKYNLDEDGRPRGDQDFERWW